MSMSDVIVEPPEDVELEQLGPKSWTWVYQGPTGSFFRGIAYKSQASARKAGREWLRNRQDPRRRGR
jgi:hypothetical protein